MGTVVAKISSGFILVTLGFFFNYVFVFCVQFLRGKVGGSAPPRYYILVTSLSRGGWFYIKCCLSFLPWSIQRLMCVLEGFLGCFPPRALSKLMEALCVQDAWAVYVVCPWWYAP